MMIMSKLQSRRSRRTADSPGWSEAKPSGTLGTVENRTQAHEVGGRFRAKSLAAVFLSPVSRALNDVDYETQGSLGLRPRFTLGYMLPPASRVVG